MELSLLSYQVIYPNILYNWDIFYLVDLFGNLIESLGVLV